MVRLKCSVCNKPYMGYDDSDVGVPPICCICDAERVDTTEITKKLPEHMEEHYALGSGGDVDE